MVAFSIVAGVTLIIGILNYLINNHTTTLLEKMATVEVPKMMTSLEAQANLSQMALSRQTYLIERDPATLEQYHLAEQNFERHLTSLEHMGKSLDTDHNETIQELRQDFTAWQTLSLQRDASPQAENELRYSNQAEPILERMHATLGAMIIHQHQVLRSEFYLHQQNLEEAQMGILGGTFFVVVLAFAIAFALIKNIIPPIQQLTEAAQRIRQGNLDTTAPVMTNDEIGTFAQTFNEMTHRLRLTIEQQTQTEAALRESKENLQTLFDTVEDFLFVVDSEGHLITVNAFFLKHMDYTAEEINGMHILNLRHPERRAEAMTNIANTLAGKTRFCNVPLMGRHGQQVEVETKVAPGYWNNIPVYFGVSRDITERIAAQQKIQAINAELAQINAELEQRVLERTDALQKVNQQLESNRKTLHTLIDGLEDGLMLLDNQGTILAVNHTLACLMHSSPEEMVNMPWQSVCLIGTGHHPNSSGHVLCSMQAMPPGTHHKTYTDSDGQKHILDIHIHSLDNQPLMAQQNQEPTYGSIMHVVDVTQRFQMEARLVQNERYAATGRIAATVAHEINTPLQAMEGLCHIIASADKHERELCIRQIQDEITHIGGILHRLVAHSATESEALVWSQVHEVIDDILLLTKGILAKQHILVSKAFADNIPPIYCQQGHIKHVLLNLIINAVDAMPHGGTLTITTYLVTNELHVLSQQDTQSFSIHHALLSDTEHHSPSVAIGIADTGRGIEPRILQRIFEPFFTTKEKRDGAGMGLTLTQQIVSMYGGVIMVSSEPGNGTLVTIIFPVDSPQFKQDDAFPMSFC
jgi:PAS domain S-box-containing protein